MAVTEPATPADIVGARKLTASAATTGLGQPSVVVDNLHVTYRVYGGRKAVGGAEAGLVPPAQSAVYVSGEPSLLGVNAC